MGKKNRLLPSLTFILICVSLYYAVTVLRPGRILFSYRLNRLIPDSAASDFNLSRTLLNVSGLFDPETDVDAIDNELGKWAAEIKADTSADANDEVVVEKFNNYIFKYLNFHYDQDALKRQIGKTEPTPEIDLDLRLINRVFQRKSGVCSGLSYICLMVAEKAGLPICAVGMPRHLLVRFEAPGRTPINIEATNGGAEIYDYEDHYNPVCRGDSKFYGKCMDKKGVLASYLGELGIIMRRKHDYDRSDVMFRKALEFCPEDPRFYWDNAEIFWRSGNYAKAQELIEKGLSLDPEDSGLNGILGWLYYCQNRNIKAEYYLDKAVRIDGTNEFAKKWLAKVRK